MSRFLLMISLVASACGGKQPVVETSPPRPQLEVDGNQRLTDAVVPTAYRLDLTIDPATEQFSGSAEIDIEVKEAQPGIILHAEELEITSAKLVRGETSFDAQLQPGENNGLGLVFTSVVEAGPGTLVFEYTAPLDDVPAGLYRVEDEGRWYAFTQFEPLEARQAFPSFDEPKFKTPFSVTMRVPTGQVALTNTPETGRETAGDLDVVTFAASKPLPTYLVAFAVGEFDIVEAPDDAIEGVPFRLVATKGKAKLGSFMLENTPALMKELTEYFGQPYPYEKLDVIAVPNFAAGAMENVGLVTFRETLLLLDPATASVSQKRAAMSVMAHELAHMWFGNLVTLPWWDEIWLNEGFATWMAAKVVNNLMPELEGRIDGVSGKSWVMSADSKAQARPIRQEIAHGGDIYNAFGAIAYGKGKAVLQLFEAWLGEDVFREGVRAYIKAHEHGTGTTEALLEAFETASGKPVIKAMGTFLDQPGAPLLTTKLQCEDGKKPTVLVEQSRYLPAGSTAEQTGPWDVPVCIAIPKGREVTTECTLVTGKSSVIELKTDKCPAWYYPNGGEVGYYRWKTEDENFEKLIGSAFEKFEDATKVEFLSNLAALSKAEVIDATKFLGIVKKMRSQKHRAIVRQVVSTLYSVEEAVPDARRTDFEKAVAKVLKPHLKRVGFEPADGEAVERSLLRPTVVNAAAFLAKDPDAISWANDASTRFFKEMAAVSAETARLAVPIAAWQGDASLWLSYKLAVDNAPTPIARIAVISGLGSFRNPSLLKKSLDMFFTESIRSQDMWTLMGPSFSTDETFAVTWEWFKENYDRIVEKVGHKAIPRLAGVGSGFCSTEGRAEVQQFFSDPAHRKPGIERRLANTLEGIDQCIRRRAYLQGGVDALLK